MLQAGRPGCGLSLYSHNKQHDERLSALGAITHSLPTFDLPRSQPVAFTRKGVTAGLKFQPDGRASQTKNLAKPVNKVLTIATGQPVGLITMNNNNRRIAPTLMCIAELYAAPTYYRWRMFFDNIFLGAGHYSTDTLLKHVGASETSGLAGLLGELGILGVFCILLYVRFFKHFKILALPIVLIWLNGEFMQYTPISLFILTHMVDDIGQKLFPAIKIDSPN